MTSDGKTITEPGIASIVAIAGQIEALNERAVREYGPIVENILLTGNRDTREIEWTLDGLLDFCGHPPVLELYRRLCRHYWNVDRDATAGYIQAYREMWDSESATEAEENK
jgi:hypothetical protein